MTATNDPSIADQLDALAALRDHVYVTDLMAMRYHAPTDSSREFVTLAMGLDLRALAERVRALERVAVYAASYRRRGDDGDELDKALDALAATVAK